MKGLSEGCGGLREEVDEGKGEVSNGGGERSKV